MKKMFANCLNKETKANLFQALLSDGLRIYLDLEDDRVGLANETPHLDWIKQ